MEFLKFVKQITMSAKKTEYLMEIGDKTWINLPRLDGTRFTIFVSGCWK